jgi:hypothetical protein
VRDLARRVPRQRRGAGRRVPHVRTGHRTPAGRSSSAARNAIGSSPAPPPAR